jgi:hypothetical protein
MRIFWPSGVTSYPPKVGSLLVPVTNLTSKPALTSKQHGDAQQCFSLFVHNQFLISHEDGLAFSLNGGHWKDHICALCVDGIASDSFEQNQLTLPACTLAHVKLCVSVDGIVADATLVKSSCH